MLRTWFQMIFLPHFFICRKRTETLNFVTSWGLNKMLVQTKLRHSQTSGTPRETSCRILLSHSMAFTCIYWFILWYPPKNVTHSVLIHFILCKWPNLSPQTNSQAVSICLNFPQSIVNYTQVDISIDSCPWQHFIKGHQAFIHFTDMYVEPTWEQPVC